MQNPPPGQQSSMGLAPNVAAALGYIWIVGLIFFFIEKENKFIRFHAMQSVLYGALWLVIVIALLIVSAIVMVVAGVASAAAGDAGGLVGVLLWLISMIVWLIGPLVYLGGLILGAVKGYQGQVFRFPVIGNMAEKIAGGSA
ncbi:MAG TPA: hypothetical protein VGQ39_07905 [Pyrinomonadaceae bacterium]|nr:hypothetical protein [Pyrinomonadaceae bacterium]